jgi:uncharacterized protein
MTMTPSKLDLSCLSDVLVICRLEADDPVPAWALRGGFVSITRTADELSVVCRSEDVPEGVRCVKNYRCIKVEGPLGFDLTGIISSLTTALARAGISVFVVSTFDTDYFLVTEDRLEKAIVALSQAGHDVRR